MPKKKVVKKKVSVRKAAPRKKSTSYGELFDAHPNLKWLLPAMLIIILAFFVIYTSVPSM
jgi:hypothetical protein